MTNIQAQKWETASKITETLTTKPLCNFNGNSYFTESMDPMTK